LGAAVFAALLALPGIASEARAQSQPIFQQGDSVVTGFSGADPKGLIDLDGASARILRLTPEGPPEGQVLPAPPVFRARAGDVGQVFAVTLDDASVRNIYLGATSAFGLQIVVPDADGDGMPDRVKTGRPNAGWMAGQFGPAGGPGSIYRIDGTTGVVTPFATIGANSGPGLGDVVFDPESRQFFASDLDTGLIHRLDANGIPVDSFDHGIAVNDAFGLAPVPDDGAIASITDPSFNAEDPATWGFTPKARRIGGMAVRDGRLYYAVANGPQIWSVGIGRDGAFTGDARLEIDASSLGSADAVADITFDDEGRIYLAQRGEQKGGMDYSAFAAPHTSTVARFARDSGNPSIWLPEPDTYAVGTEDDHRDAAGGVAIGQGVTETGEPSGICNMLWSTGSGLKPAPGTLHGMQGTDISAVRPLNEPPTAAYFVGDGQTAPDAAGHDGDVETWPSCGGEPSPVRTEQTGAEPEGEAGEFAEAEAGDEPWFMTVEEEGGPHLVIRKKADGACKQKGGAVGGWNCKYTVTVTNEGSETHHGPIRIIDQTGFKAGKLTADPAGWICTGKNTDTLACLKPMGTLAPGKSRELHVNLHIAKKDAVGAPCEMPNLAILNMSPGGSDSTVAALAAKDCVKTPKPGETPKLSIGKESFGCHEAGLNWLCVFQMSIRNDGTEPFAGPHKV
jgi:hypothetical protein